MGTMGSVGMGPVRAVLAAGTRRPSTLTRAAAAGGCIWGGVGEINVTAMLEPRTAVYGSNIISGGQGHQRLASGLGVLG